MDRATSYFQRNGKSKEVGEVRTNRSLMPLVPQRAAERGALQSGSGHTLKANRATNGDERVRLDGGRVSESVRKKVFIKLLKNTGWGCIIRGEIKERAMPEGV